MRQTEPKPQPFLLDLLRRLFKQRPLGAASAVVVLVLAVIAILADILAPFPFRRDAPGRPVGRPVGRPTCWAPTSSAATC